MGPRRPLWLLPLASTFAHRVRRLCGKCALYMVRCAPCRRRRSKPAKPTACRPRQTLWRIRSASWVYAAARALAKLWMVLIKRTPRLFLLASKTCDWAGRVWRGQRRDAYTDYPQPRLARMWYFLACCVFLTLPLPCVRIVLDRLMRRLKVRPNCHGGRSTAKRRRYDLLDTISNPTGCAILATIGERLLAAQ